MDNTATIQGELELTPEQKKVLRQVYRLILSWGCEISETSTPDDERSENTPGVAPVLEAKL